MLTNRNTRYLNISGSFTTLLNTCLPFSGSLSVFNHFEAWNLSKHFHCNGHEQAAAISIAAGSVYHQEYHKEDHHDDANHTAFGHAGAHLNRRGKNTK